MAIPPPSVKIPKAYQPVKNKIARNILIALFIGAAVPVLLSSPYGLYFIVRAGVRYYFRKNDFHREIKRMEKRGYVALTKTPEGFLVRLLKKGEKPASIAEMQSLKLSKVSEWDRKWRLFIFDIPEKQRSQRDLIRKKLKELGLYNIQRSVFVYPYDCREELKFITGYYDIDKYTTYVEADYIDIDKQLRKHFGLA